MPGSGKQSNEVQAQIKELLEAGFDPTTIHRRLKVGRSSIYRMKRCLEQHGTNYMPPELNKKNGRPKVLTAEQELVSLHLYDSRLCLNFVRMNAVARDIKQMRLFAYDFNLNIIRS
jgi:transposase